MSTQIVTKLSSKKLDTGPRKKTLSTGSGKKSIKKSQSHKRKPAALSVKEKADGLHSLQDCSTLTSNSDDQHSYVSDKDILSQGKQKTGGPSLTRPSSSVAEKNAERKRALVEKKRLEKEQLEKERSLRENENLQLQELLERERQEQLQHQKKTDANDDIDGKSSLEIPKLECPYVTPGQVSGLAALERLKVLETGLELSAADEALNEKATQREQEVDELLQKAKDAEAAYLAELRERERLQRIKEVTANTTHGL